MKLFKAMATVAGMTAISRVAGFARDIMTAAFLGAGPIADAFFVALKLPNFFRRITAEGAFSVSFVPIYSAELTEQGRESADLFSHRAFSFMLFVLMGFTALAMLAMPFIIQVIAPGFSEDPEKYEMAIEFSRITFPYLLLMSLSSLLGGVMNAHDKFAPFAFAPVLFNLSLIGALLFNGLFENAGQAMSWGVMLAGVLQFLMLMGAAQRLIGYKIKIMWPEISPRIKRLFKLMLPGMIGAGVVQINLFADMIIASFLPTGAISYLYYADRLNQLPLSTVGIAVGTALLPMLSRAVAAKDTSEAGRLYSRAMEITLFLGLPATLGLVVLAHPIISVLFERGEFSAEAAQATAYALQGYVIGLPAYIGVKVFSTAYWSDQDTLTPVKVSALAVATNIMLALVLVQFIGVAGIALSTGLVGWLHLLLLAMPLKDHPCFILDDRFMRVMPRLVLSSFFMIAMVGLLYFFIGHYAFDAGVIRYLTLAVLVMFGAMAYGLAVHYTGALKLSEIKRYFKKEKA